MKRKFQTAASSQGPQSWGTSERLGLIVSRSHPLHNHLNNFLTYLTWSWISWYAVSCSWPCIWVSCSAAGMGLSDLLFSTSNTGGTIWIRVTKVLSCSILTACRLLSMQSVTQEIISLSFQLHLIHFQLHHCPLLATAQWMGWVACRCRWNVEVPRWEPGLPRLTAQLTYITQLLRCAGDQYRKIPNCRCLGSCSRN